MPKPTAGFPPMTPTTRSPPGHGPGETPLPGVSWGSRSYLGCISLAGREGAGPRFYSHKQKPADFHHSAGKRRLQGATGRAPAASSQLLHAGAASSCLQRQRALHLLCSEHARQVKAPHHVCSVKPEVSDLYSQSTLAGVRVNTGCKYSVVLHWFNRARSVL